MKVDCVCLPMREWTGTRKSCFENFFLADLIDIVYLINGRIKFKSKVVVALLSPTSNHTKKIMSSFLLLDLVDSNNSMIFGK